MHAHARVVRRIERDLSAAGLPPLSWYDVLWALYEAPGRRLRIRELSDAVVLSRTGLVRLLDRIESAGLLRREAVPEDHRGAYAAITADGARVLRRMWPVYERGISEYFAAHLGDEAGAVHAALGRVADAG